MKPVAGAERASVCTFVCVFTCSVKYVYFFLFLFFKDRKHRADLMESGRQLIFSGLFGILWKECVDGLHCWLLQ